MRKTALFALLFSILITGCGTVVIDGPINRNPVRYVPFTLGGTTVQVSNDIHDSLMCPAVVGTRFASDRAPGDAVMPQKCFRTGELAEFFFRNIGLAERESAVILLTFYELVSNVVGEVTDTIRGAYLGRKELRVRLRNRGGEHDAQVFQIDDIEMPRRVRRRD